MPKCCKNKRHLLMRLSEKEKTVLLCFIIYINIVIFQFVKKDMIF